MSLGLVQDDTKMNVGWGEGIPRKVPGMGVGV